MNLKPLGIVLVGILFVLGIWYVNNDWVITNYPSNGSTVIAFGDSLIEGVGATKGNDLVSILSRMINTPIINAGVSGNTTDHGVMRLENDVLSKDPKVVIVLLGGNDYLRRIPKETTFNNLEKIVDDIHQEGAVVVLLGIRGGLLKDTYERDFKEFAKRKGVAYVPNVLDDVLGNNELMFDAIHPNDNGYSHIARRVAPVLIEVLR